VARDGDVLSVTAFDQIYGQEGHEIPVGLSWMY